MKKEEIYDILKTGLVELFEIDENQIHPETKMYDDLDIDSIDAIDLIDHLKQKTGYRLLPEDFQNIVTLDDIASIVEKKLAS
ncbi:MAG: acyl carrier protein [Arcobacter sp.]|nr:acyl carrier protein [Arcobacter sp.]